MAVAAILLAGACNPTVDTPTATPTGTPAIIAPASGTPARSSPTPAASSPSPTRTAAALAAPTRVRLEGRLPDPSAPVPPGEGEAGRVTVRWEGAEGATGFLVHVKGCNGTRRPPIDVPASDRQYGPLQPCRPDGNVGVSAVYPSGESAIAWVR